MPKLAETGSGPCLRADFEPLDIVAPVVLRTDVDAEKT
jgi:hypothetical protein